MASKPANTLPKGPIESDKYPSWLQALTIFESLGEGIVLADREGYIYFINNRMTQLLGYSAQEFLNKRMDEVLFTSPKDEIRLNAAMMRKRYQDRLEGISETYELKVRHKNGELRWLEVNASPLRDIDENICGSVAAWTDITDRKLSEYALRESESRFKSIVQNLAEGLLLTDCEGIITFANSTMERMVGLSLSDIVSRSPAEVLCHWGGEGSKDAARRLNEEITACLDGQTRKFELTITGANSSECWMEVNAAPIVSADGEVIGSIAAYDDVTENKRLRSELHWSQKMEAVGRLAGGVAHDFNNYLTAVMGYTDIILRSLEKDSQWRRPVEGIKKASELGVSLSQQLLTFSRKQVIKYETFDLNRAVSNAVQMAKSFIGDKIDLDVQLAKEPVWIEADISQIQQVLLNLAINARDAIGDSPGALSLTTSTVELTEPLRLALGTIDPGWYALVQVSDTGCGIQKDVQGSIFEPFFSTKKNGSGLGLSTVYGIVRQHQGMISVRSSVDQGSVFSVYFPLKSLGAREAGEVKKISAGWVIEKYNTEVVASNGSGKTVLVVDDEEVVRNMVEHVLLLCGYKVISCDNGYTAMALFTEHKEEIDLVVTDIVMPGMNGHELAKKLSAAKPDLRLLMMSGYTDDKDLVENLSRRGIPFLAKPFNAEQLAERVDQVSKLEPEPKLNSA